MLSSTENLRITEEILRTLAEQTLESRREMLELREMFRLSSEKHDAYWAKVEEERAERADDMAKQDKEHALIRQRLKILENHWGDFIEAFVDHQAIELFKDINIEITEMTKRGVKGCVRGENYEFDIMMKNDNVIIFVEAKTTLEADHVKKFIEKLKKVKSWIPDFKNYTVYGAVAFMQEKNSASSMAANRGLFTIAATAKSASITNAVGFVPTAF